MKKIVFCLLALMMTGVSASACFAVIAGRGTTVDGSVMLAHDEDDSGEQMLNVYQVARGAVGDNVKYTWWEFPGMKVADAFMNEYGVACASDGCPSREDVKDYTDGGVLYEVRTLIAQKAHSAREAVQLVGQLVTARGYADSGRTYVVADCKEGWIISVVRGRHWVAQRIPDDKVMALPNNYIIDQIDLSDTDNFAGSPDLAEYAQKRGWWNPADGPFSFKKAYTDPKFYTRPSNVNRHQHALEILTGKAYEPNPDSFEFCVTPKQKVTKELLMDVLACHFAAEPDKNGQHISGICTSVDILAMIFQLRSNMPVEIGAMAWVAAGHPCVEAFLPWYSGMTQSPKGFCRYATAKEAIDKHFTDVKDKQKNYPDAMAWNFTDRWKAVTANYNALIAGIKQQNQKFQQKWFNNQTKFEASLKKFYDAKTGKITNRKGLETALNAYTAKAYKEYLGIIKKEKR